MPVLNVGDFQIAVDTVQNTEHALGIKNSKGEIYYAPVTQANCPSSLKIKSGDTIYTVGQSTLIHEITTVNMCETISLMPGCYTVMIMGGSGGDGGNKPNTGSDAVQEVYSFNLTQTTNVYAFRGGDGNNGGVNLSSSGIYSGGGGGASGVPSMFQVGENYIISQGGNGGNGTGGYNNNKEEQNCGAGGGGSADVGGNGLGAAGTDSLGSTGFVCGAGGGGAVSGQTGSASSGFLYNGSAGADATEAGGGAGGDSSVGGLLGSSKAAGGVGGQNVSYTCGSVVMYSYGGGGGGAVSTGGLFGVGVGVNGGAGGSGSTGVSSTSYVRIYRVG